MAQHYYALEKADALEDKHENFFYAVHEKKLNISSSAHLAKWTRDELIEGYEKAFNSIYVKRKVTFADQLARRLKIASVPTLLVNGKYIITINDKVGTTRMLDILDYLVKKEVNTTSSAR